MRNVFFALILLSTTLFAQLEPTPAVREDFKVQSVDSYVAYKGLFQPVNANGVSYVLLKDVTSVRVNIFSTKGSTTDWVVLTYKGEFSMPIKLKAFKSENGENFYVAENLKPGEYIVQTVDQFSEPQFDTITFAGQEPQPPPVSDDALVKILKTIPNDPVVAQKLAAAYATVVPTATDTLESLKSKAEAARIQALLSVPLLNTQWNGLFYQLGEYVKTIKTKEQYLSFLKTLSSALQTQQVLNTNNCVNGVCPPQVFYVPQR